MIFNLNVDISLQILHKIQLMAGFTAGIKSKILVFILKKFDNHRIVRAKSQSIIFKGHRRQGL